MVYLPISGYGIIFRSGIRKSNWNQFIFFIAIKLKLSDSPNNSKWSQMLGAGLLAGIGFTMSIFIALLSYKGELEIQEEAKFAILVASAISGFMGYFY